jgi:hypothetical protein
MKGWYIGSPANLERLEQQMSRISVPINFCSPMKISEIKKWKGIDLKNWCVYYSEYVLKGK